MSALKKPPVRSKEGYMYGGASHIIDSEGQCQFPIRKSFIGVLGMVMH